MLYFSGSCDGDHESSHHIRIGIAMKEKWKHSLVNYPCKLVHILRSVQMHEREYFSLMTIDKPTFKSQSRLRPIDWSYFENFSFISIFIPRKCDRLIDHTLLVLPKQSTHPKRLHFKVYRDEKVLMNRALVNVHWNQLKFLEMP
jgi:hypothetical protein